MRYEWDENKNRSNRDKHGVDFVMMEHFEWETALVILDNREDYGEKRYRTMGFIFDRVHVAVFTIRSDAFRIINLRKANDREVKLYEERQRKS